jgi:hypothetical protein
MKGQYRIPFKDGQMLNYPQAGGELVDNFEFEDTLVYSTFSRGNSSALLIFVSATTKKKYSMFLVDFEKLANSISPIQNSIPLAYKAKWTFCKRGQNYGVTLA